MALLADVAAPFEGCRITSNLPSCFVSPSSSSTAFKELFTSGDGFNGDFVDCRLKKPCAFLCKLLFVVSSSKGGCNLNSPDEVGLVESASSTNFSLFPPRLAPPFAAILVLLFELD